MSDQRGIQKFEQRSPAGAIMTPQGPAIIQVIDMPAMGIGPVGPAARKPGGINIFSAIVKRWWLVLICTLVVGGAGYYAGIRFIKPAYEARATVSYYDNRPNAEGQSTGDGKLQNMVATAKDLMNSNAPDMTMLAVQDPEMQRVFPELAHRDLSDPAVKQAVIKEFKDVVTAEDVTGKDFLDIVARRGDPSQSVTLSNAYANALCKFVKDAITGQDSTLRKSLTDQVAADQQEKQTLVLACNKLKADNLFDVKEQEYAAMIKRIVDIRGDKDKAEVELAAAEAKYKQFQSNGERHPDQELQRLQIIADETQRDSVLQMLIQEKSAAMQHLTELGATMTPDHPDYQAAQRQVDMIESQRAKRLAEISAIIDQKVSTMLGLQTAANMEQAQQAMQIAQAQLNTDEAQLKQMDSEAIHLAQIQFQVEELQQQLDFVQKQLDENNTTLQSLRVASNDIKMSDMIKVMTPAEEAKLTEDKRVKVQAAGMVGGLFLGVLLALLIDRFDKRLRNPRDIEPLLGAPLLGSIPRIQELKKAKGEQARNLIAEEFRIIRTQVLFGNPQLQQKLIAVTSPSPGDGKTSLAVNLAISIAKAGRRVLLVDADMRKPDVHRIFNLPEGPGFSELIQGTTDTSAAIRKPDIENLEILTAGTPTPRPSELLSRPEMAKTLALLAEMYDHVILDTAPLLPVSDTHVIVGHVDGTICSFDAEVDRDTVAHCHDILRRSRAVIIGSVMNQVKYKQSGSYQRGKSAYDSYYNSPRNRTSAPLAKGGPSDATMNDVG